MEAARLMVSVGAETGEAERKLAGMSGHIESFASNAQRLGMSMTRYLTVPITTAAAGSVAAFGRLDNSMTQSLAIMGNVGSGMRAEMENTAREIGRTTTFGAHQAAEAYFFLASAGLDAEASMAALPRVAQFAQAGMFDLARATDLLTDAQSSLGLTVRDDAVANMENMVRVSDVLVGANTLANASVEQFSEALTNRAGPRIRAMNMDLEEGVAVLAAFADQGIKGAEAGTRFDMILRDLATKARTNADEFRRLGIEVFDASGEFNNMADIIGQMEVAFAGLSTEQIMAELALLGFTDRAISGVLALLGMSDAIRGYESDLRSMSGVTEEVASKQLESFTAQMTLAKDRIIDAGIVIGADLAPHVLTATTALSGLVDMFVALPDPIRHAAMGVAGLVAAAGPLLLTIGGIAAIAPAMGAGLAFLAPAAPVVLGAIALGGAIYIIAQNWDEWKSMMPATVSGLSQIQDQLQRLDDLMRREIGDAGLFATLGDTALRTISANIGSILLAIEGLATGVELVFSRIKTLYQLANTDIRDWGDVFREESERNSGALERLRESFGTYINSVIGAGDSSRDFVLTAEEMTSALDAQEQAHGRNEHALLNHAGAVSHWDSVLDEATIALNAQHERLIALDDAYQVLAAAQEDGMELTSEEAALLAILTEEREKIIEAIRQEELELAALQARQLLAPDIIDGISVEYERYEARVRAAADATDRLSRDTDFSSMRREAQATAEMFAAMGEAARNAADAIISATMDMAMAYDTVHGHVSEAASAVSHWERMNKDATDSMIILKNEIEATGDPTGELTSRLETMEWWVDRTAGGVHDLTLEWTANVEMLAEAHRAHEALREEYEAGNISLEEYNAASSELAAMLDPVTAAQMGLAESFEHVSEIIGENITRLEDLMIALGLLPDREEIEIEVLDQQALAALDDIQEQAILTRQEGETLIVAAVDAAEAVRRFVDVEGSAISAREAGETPIVVNVDTLDALLKIAAVEARATALSLLKPVITVTADISAVENEFARARRLSPSSPAQEGPLAFTPDWSWMFEGMAFEAEKATEQTIEYLQDLANRIRGSWGGPQASAIASAMVEGVGADVSRLPELIGNVTPEVLAEIEIMRAGIADKLHLAKIVGDEEKIAELHGQLGTIQQIMIAWAHETGIGAGEALGGILDADRMIAEIARVADEIANVADYWGRILTDHAAFTFGEMYQQIKGQIADLDQQIEFAMRHDAPPWIIERLIGDREQMVIDLHEAATIYRRAIEDGLALSPGEHARFDFWTTVFGEFDSIISGDFEERLQSEMQRLRDQIILGELVGVPAAMIEQWQDELDEKQAEITALGEMHAAAYAAGLIPGVEALSEETIERLTEMLDASAALAPKLIDDLVTAVLDGRVSWEQAVNLIPSTAIPALERLEEAWTVKLAQAIIDGNQTMIDSTEEMVRIISGLLGELRADLAQTASFVQSAWHGPGGIGPDQAWSAGSGGSGGGGGGLSASDISKALGVGPKGDPPWAPHQQTRSKLEAMFIGWGTEDLLLGWLGNVPWVKSEAYGFLDGAFRAGLDEAMALIPAGQMSQASRAYEQIYGAKWWEERIRHHNIVGNTVPLISPSGEILAEPTPGIPFNPIELRTEAMIWHLNAELEVLAEALRVASQSIGMIGPDTALIAEIENRIAAATAELALQPLFEDMFKFLTDLNYAAWHGDWEALPNAFERAQKELDAARETGSQFLPVLEEMVDRMAQMLDLWPEEMLKGIGAVGGALGQLSTTFDEFGWATRTGEMMQRDRSPFTTDMTEELTQKATSAGTTLYQTINLDGKVLATSVANFMHDGQQNIVSFAPGVPRR